MLNAQEILDASQDGQGYKCLPINVFFTSYQGKRSDCTNGGISGQTEDLFLICPGGNYNTLSPHVRPEQICRIADHPTVEGHQYIVPCDANGAYERGSMFGGNYGGSSDSRFYCLSKRPVAIHDRFE